jgi:hypothetical protein
MELEGKKIKLQFSRVTPHFPRGGGGYRGGRRSYFKPRRFFNYRFCANELILSRRRNSRSYSRSKSRSRSKDRKRSHRNHKGRKSQSHSSSHSRSDSKKKQTSY